jgi:GMP synthase-like glutamine amidotransferase
MRALFLQHDPGALPGAVGDRFEARGFTVDTLAMANSIADAVYTGPFPDPTGYDVLVPLGAIWSLYDHAAIGTWVERELDLLRRAAAAGVPVLGICFGAQALAAAHGGTVTAAARPEIGYGLVRSDVPDLIPEGPWMQWHSDAFGVPAGSVELARNDVSPQAFRRGRDLGVQFHPEVQPEGVALWLELGGDDAERALAGVGMTPDGLLDDAERHAAQSAANAARLVDGFLDRIARIGGV